MKKYKVLVLTDHSGHSEQNSIYTLLNEMNQHHQCEQIDVASRGLSINDNFFSDLNTDELHGSKVLDDFQYDENGSHYKINLRKLDPKEYNLVFLRLPRPISDQFLIWLEEIFSNAKFVNSPNGIIKTSSKEYLLSIPEVCPTIKKINSREEAIAFASIHPIVLKPLREYGGKGVVKIVGDKVYDGDEEYNRNEYLESIKETLESDGYIGMKYLKNVSQGDKRILVVGGEILAASLRIPKKGSWLCNISQGGQSVKTEITPEEEVIIKTISPDLMKNGIVIYGADTLVDDDGKRVLSEINTLSIGGFPQAQAQTGKPIIKTTIDKIFQYADEYK